MSLFRSVPHAAQLELQPELQVSAQSFEHVPAGRLTKKIHLYGLRALLCLSKVTLHVTCELGSKAVISMNTMNLNVSEYNYDMSHH